MWPLLGQPDVGSYFYSGSVNSMNMLDQFIISKGLYFGSRGLRATRALDGNGAELGPVAAAIFDPDLMLTDPSPNRAWRRPKRFSFGRNAAGVVTNNGGFSDHFPIQMVIETV
jgi:hypothetical protein